MIRFSYSDLTTIQKMVEQNALEGAAVLEYSSTIYRVIFVTDIYTCP